MTPKTSIERGSLGEYQGRMGTARKGKEVKRMSAKQYRKATPEKTVHMQILNWLRWQYPKAVIHHSANERKGEAAGKRAKDMGQLAGFPDLIVMHEGHAWFFEVKAEGGRLSTEQKFFASDIERNGFRWACVRSVEDVEDAIEEWSRDIPHLPVVGFVS